MPTQRSDLSTKNDLKAQQGGQMSNLVEIFGNVDDFCMQFCPPQWQAQLKAPFLIV